MTLGANMFRKSPLLISVPLDGTDTVPGLVRLQQRRRQDALEEKLGIPKGKTFLLVTPLGHQNVDYRLLHYGKHVPQLTQYIAMQPEQNLSGGIRAPTSVSCLWTSLSSLPNPGQTSWSAPALQTIRWRTIFHPTQACSWIDWRRTLYSSW